jgi:hypothetical protein
MVCCGQSEPRQHLGAYSRLPSTFAELRKRGVTSQRSALQELVISTSPGNQTSPHVSAEITLTPTQRSIHVAILCSFGVACRGRGAALPVLASSNGSPTVAAVTSSRWTVVDQAHQRDLTEAVATHSFSSPSRAMPRRQGPSPSSIGPHPPLRIRWVSSSSSWGGDRRFLPPQPRLRGCADPFRPTSDPQSSFSALMCP